jgi:hypothetical protein
MARARTVWLNGAVSIAPLPCGSSQGIGDVLNLSLVATYQASKAAPLSIASTEGTPTVVALDSIVRVRFIALKVNSYSSVQMIVTSAAGATQRIPVSGLFVWYAPNAGDEITAISLVGTADVELLLAGDLN